MRNRSTRIAALALLAANASAQAPQAPRRSQAPARDGAAYVPALKEAAAPDSELRPLVERYQTDRAALLRLWSVPGSEKRREKLASFYRTWQARLAEVRWDGLGVEGRVDATLLRQELAYELGLLAREELQAKETAPLLPAAAGLAALQEARRMLLPPDHKAAAQTLDDAARAFEAAQKGLKSASPKPSKVVAARAAQQLADLKRVLQDWFSYSDSYDPSFSWWTREPYKKLTKATDDYAKALREDVVGVKPGQDEPIVGDPIGRQALLDDLVNEMIPYTPEELVAIANREFAWCESEMKKASREMGFGDDWKKALDKVRTLYVEPGKQPELVRELALEAIDFVQKKDLVTVPPLAADVWRMEMMSPERQKIAPFFLGGEVIQVSYPTDTMAHEDKLNSLRANNVHFSRAVVHHELIPGHHLQGFMGQRHNPHRRLFQTPFHSEGWALWWEFLLWDQGFPRTPEDKVGMLFWRMHRCARIIFSLSFHLGTMSPEQCIDFLVDRVGHDRWTATGEVRRSFAGQYSPLYQAAYMLGGLQFRALHEQLVKTGKLTNREFHDRILRGGPIPVEMVRVLLLNEGPAREFRAAWKFAGERP
jgi:hypothetical protein